MGNDPRQIRLTGWTAHGNHRIDVPFISEIANNLWQGGCQDGLVLPSPIKHLLSLYRWEKYTVNHRLRTSHEVTMHDSVDQNLGEIDRWARWVNARRKTGAVLVHCQAGLNRSGLVVARALMLEGWTATEAIRLVRGKRSAACLCNPTFEKWLRDQ